MYLPQKDLRCGPMVPWLVGGGRRGRGDRPGGLVGVADSLAGVAVAQRIHSMAMGFRRYFDRLGRPS